MLQNLLKKITLLPWISSQLQALYFIRIAGLLCAGGWVFAIIGYELYWFCEFSAQTPYEVWTILVLITGYLITFTTVAFIQASAYIGWGTHQFNDLKTHLPMQIAIITLFGIAIAICHTANYGDVTPIYLMLCFIPISVISAVLWLPIAFPLLIGANVIAILSFDSISLISTFYLILQQLVLMVMVRSQFNEHEVKHKMIRKNDELIATQSLLSEASRQNERLKIARNIHDIVGHHMTALTLNLETLKHTTEGKVQQDISVVQNIAKDLLNEVRHAVSTYRMNVSLPLEDTLKKLTAHVPNLKIKLNVDPSIHIKNTELAECLLRCCQEMITNTLRHAHARLLSIEIYTENKELYLTCTDNGNGVRDKDFVPGNGLNGMFERIKHNKGTMEIKRKYKEGFKISITFPFDKGEP